MNFYFVFVFQEHKNLILIQRHICSPFISKNCLAATFFDPQNALWHYIKIDRKEKEKMIFWSSHKGLPILTHGPNLAIDTILRYMMQIWVVRFGDPLPTAWGAMRSFIHCCTQHAFPLKSKCLSSWNVFYDCRKSRYYVLWSAKQKFHFQSM